MATRLDALSDEVLQEAFLYNDPDSFKAGVLRAIQALGELETEPVAGSGNGAGTVFRGQIPAKRRSAPA